ncbi:protein kinase domain-containing protein [Spirillospora sp. CA-253888]
MGPYTLVARLGEGGMGVVYLGRGPDGRNVAIKVIQPDLAADADYRARFHDEVRHARQVASFCTAAVLDHGEADGRPYLVTEYVEGTPLSRHIRRHGALPPDTLHGVALGVAAALATIHAAGLVHRDLKPANVILSISGPRVIDFGIARGVGDLTGRTRSGLVMGSPGWIAPEQVQHGEVSPASDVFTWGCLVAFAGMARHPFAGTDARASNDLMVLTYRAQQHLHDLEGLAEPLRSLVEQTLSPEPDLRPTARDLLLALVGGSAEADASLPIAGTPPAKTSGERNGAHHPGPDERQATQAPDSGEQHRAENPASGEQHGAQSSDSGERHEPQSPSFGERHESESPGSGERVPQPRRPPARSPDLAPAGTPLPPDDPVLSAAGQTLDRHWRLEELPLWTPPEEPPPAPPALDLGERRRPPWTWRRRALAILLVAGAATAIIVYREGRAPTEGEFGRPAHDGDFSFEASPPECDREVEGVTAKDGKLCQVRFTVTNTGVTAHVLDPVHQRLHGRTDPDETAIMVFRGDASDLGERAESPSVATSTSFSGVLLYDVPPGFSPVELELHVDASSPGVRLRLASAPRK